MYDKYTFFQVIDKYTFITIKYLRLMGVFMVEFTSFFKPTRTVVHEIFFGFFFFNKLETRPPCPEKNRFFQNIFADYLQILIF